jgi:hypothetical protein
MHSKCLTGQSPASQGLLLLLYGALARFGYLFDI